MRPTIAATAVVLLAAALLSGCQSGQAASGPRRGHAPPTPSATSTRAAAGAVGAPLDPQLAPTPAKSILDDPKGWDAKTVLVEGTIARECPTGCWLYLRDATGEIRIELKQESFTAPLQQEGKTIRVMGEVYAGRQETMVLGKGLAIGGKAGAS